MFFTEYNLGMTVVIVVSYLLGSVPTAYLIAKLHKINIFEIGSGNMGGTNVARALGIRWGIYVAIFDVLKGVIAIIIAQKIMPSENVASATTVAAITVVIGHNWSLFATILTGTLRGGKGAAPAFGTLLMLAPVQVIVVMMLVGGSIVALTRHVSLGVLIAFFIAILWLTVLILQRQLDSGIMVYIWMLAALLLIRFKENIQRLLAGTERRLGERA